MDKTINSNWGFIAELLDNNCYICEHHDDELLIDEDNDDEKWYPITRNSERKECFIDTSRELPSLNFEGMWVRFLGDFEEGCLAYDAYLVRDKESFEIIAVGIAAAQLVHVFILKYKHESEANLLGHYSNGIYWRKTRDMDLSRYPKDPLTEIIDFLTENN